MKSTRYPSILLTLLFCAWILQPTPRAGADDKPRSIRVLILSGVPETHHDYKNQCPNMEKLLKEQGHEVVRRDKALYEEGDAGKFDVVVLMSEKWRGDTKNRQEFLQMIKDGKGLVVIHMGYVPCVEALGGKASRNGKTGEIRIEIADKKHAITKGLGDFTAGPKDELYAGVKFTADDVHVLARGQDTSGAWEPIAWTRAYGKGRVFYTSLGHSTESQKNGGFIKLVTAGVKWVAER